jgi:hypothetical protein
MPAALRPQFGATISLAAIPQTRLSPNLERVEGTGAPDNRNACALRHFLVFAGARRYKRVDPRHHRHPWRLTRNFP